MPDSTDHDKEMRQLAAELFRSHSDTHEGEDEAPSARPIGLFGTTPHTTDH